MDPPKTFAQNSRDIKNPYCRYCRLCLPRHKFYASDLSANRPICRVHSDPANRPEQLPPRKLGMIKTRGNFVTKARKMFEDATFPRTNARLSEEEVRMLLDMYDGGDQPNCRVGGVMATRDLVIVPEVPKDGEELPEEIAHDGRTPPRPLEWLRDNFRVMTKTAALRGGHMHRNMPGIKKCKTQIESYGLAPELLEAKAKEQEEIKKRNIAIVKAAHAKRRAEAEARNPGSKRSRAGCEENDECKCAMLRDMFPGMFAFEDESFGLSM